MKLLLWSAIFGLMMVVSQHFSQRFQGHSEDEPTQKNTKPCENLMSRQDDHFLAHLCSIGQKEAKLQDRLSESLFKLFYLDPAGFLHQTVALSEFQKHQLHRLLKDEREQIPTLHILCQYPKIGAQVSVLLEDAEAIFLQDWLAFCAEERSAFQTGLFRYFTLSSAEQKLNFPLLVE